MVIPRYRACGIASSLLIGILATAHEASGHGIAGNRLFPGTLSFDDPAVEDEFAATPSGINHPATDGTAVTDYGLSWAFMRRLVPELAVAVDGGLIYRNWANLQRGGFDSTSLSLKSLLYRSDPHEILLSAELSWGIGGSGTPAVGGGGPNTISPTIVFGKGFGDLPETLGWLRPFAITGAIAAELPTVSQSTAPGLNDTTAALVPITVENLNTLHWGFSVQYSTYYLTSRFTGGPAKEEPLNQFLPLVEFAFDTPSGQKTAANMSPGLAYVADKWQVAAEIIVPLNTEAGHGVGVRTQLLLFLDDLVPSLFGKPLFSQ